MSAKQVILYLGSLVVALSIATRGRAETTQCTALTSLPTTISASGIYCLTSDFNLNLASGSAIEIAASNVVLDLNGHKLGNLTAGTGTQAFGIFAYQRQNITIKNGTIRGFETGIDLEDVAPDTTSQGHLIEGIRADRNTFYGIRVGGYGCVVRQNEVSMTGGTTALGANVSAAGIEIFGPGNRVIDNDVITVTKQGTGLASGIEFESSAENGIALNNRISYSDYGIWMIASSIKYRDNLTTGVVAPYVGGTDAGNNK